jgi:hypothetical protein
VIGPALIGFPSRERGGSDSRTRSGQWSWVVQSWVDQGWVVQGWVVQSRVAQTWLAQRMTPTWRWTAADLSFSDGELSRRGRA